MDSCALGPLTSPEMHAATGNTHGIAAKKKKKKDKNSPTLETKAYENEPFKSHSLLKPFSLFGTQEAEKCPIRLSQSSAL